MVNELTEIIKDAMKESDPKNFKGKLPTDTPIFGSKGVFDSLGLVTLLINIEQKIESKFNTTITIADEKAMSQSKSPFRSIDSLVQYLSTVLDDNE
tara:strand:+ start:127 stop:414 length:288 start_codon:yes stop_codon:yes gene_type:complete